MQNKSQATNSEAKFSKLKNVVNFTINLFVAIFNVLFIVAYYFVYITSYFIKLLLKPGKRGINMSNRGDCFYNAGFSKKWWK